MSEPTRSLMLPESDRLDEIDVKAFVEQYMERNRIEVRYDGALVQAGVRQRADTPEMVDEVLVFEELSEADVADIIYLTAVIDGYDHKAPQIKAAFRNYCRVQQALRRKALMGPYLRPVSRDVKEKSIGEWRKVGCLFDLDSELPTFVLQHFVWQVKQKVLGRPNAHHLMPIIYSAIQGSGKTTFVRNFLAPLQELASADTLVTDFADKKSGSIYRYLVVVIDDMELLPQAAVPALKSLITSDRINRRRMHSNQNISIRQRATLIGTANATVTQLVKDETGHRRFVSMPFRNGDAAKGGDRTVWDVVSSLDYSTMWASVDAFGPSPIAPYRDALIEYQNRSRPVPHLLSWLRRLDVNSSAVKAITVRAGVRADGLQELYMRTGTFISRQKFADQMSMHLGQAGNPFSEKRKVEVGAVYCLKDNLSGHSEQTHAGSEKVESLPSDTLSNAPAWSASPASSASSASPASSASSDSSGGSGKAVSNDELEA